MTPGLRSLLGAFLGVIAGRMIYEFFDELVGLDDAARSVARSVDGNTVTREVTL